MSSSTQKFPSKFRDFFKPKRYKVLYGGRGGGKSWSIARALLLLGAGRTIRVLCTREVQKSIRDSVHRLLKDSITSLGLEAHYEVLDQEIRGRNGTLFSFTGLSDKTMDSLKSYEGYHYCWCEEAHALTKDSLDLLGPTIRVDDSEIILSLNPQLETDEVYQRFVAKPRDDVWLCEINWRDNPWFPSVLDAERRKCAELSPDDYENIWEGKPVRVLPGAIYRKEIDALYKDGRARAVPYDPMLKVHTVWDLGWNDAMVIIFAQNNGAELRVIDYLESSHQPLDWYVKELERRPYRYGTDFLPHDGKNKSLQTGLSTADVLQSMGRRVSVLERTDIEEGIRVARLAFPRVYIDDAKGARLLECLKRYRRDISSKTGEATSPLHDEYSHGADAYRYLAQCAPQMRNETDWAPVTRRIKGIR